ncbi:unnamed protein product [Rhizoctonia solani]|uniref:Uncharacterized protein n=1 Tax=Rhizoctonia solani TaxID=456999 RepID=A0A8H3D2U1_9AGAM|nr:unnamed protein product [Rhizoctonia solani]
MAISVHSRWGPPLEQYVLRYDQTSVRGREEIEDEIMSSALGCVRVITTLSNEADEIKFESSAGKVTLEMLRCLWLLSSSRQGVLYLAQPPLIRGCLRLMKLVKVNGVISPFSYEYGYLCFNISKMALGVCLIEKFHRQHVADLMEHIWSNYLTKDNASILAELLVYLFTEEDKKHIQQSPRCDWIFGWSDPPAHGGHPKLIIAGSDALDLMDVLWNDRKAFLKSLSLAYTPGSSIMLFAIWQYMYRKGVLLKPVSRTPVLDTFLDLTWRFMLITTPGDYGLMFPIIMAAMLHSGKLAESAVDVEDSRNIIDAYVRGMAPAEDPLLYRQVSSAAYPLLLRFVERTLLPGTEDLYHGIVKSMLSRLWDMVSWGRLDATISPVGAIELGLKDLLVFLRIHAQGLGPRSPVMQAIIEELADKDILGLIGYSIHQLCPTKDAEPNPQKGYSDLNECMTFRDTALSMLTALNQASSSSVIPSYFSTYGEEWVKHLQYNDILLQMVGDSENARSYVKFRREVLWDVIRKIPRGLHIHGCGVRHARPRLGVLIIVARDVKFWTGKVEANGRIGNCAQDQIDLQ